MSRINYPTFKRVVCVGNYYISKNTLMSISVYTRSLRGLASARFNSAPSCRQRAAVDPMTISIYGPENAKRGRYTRTRIVRRVRTIEGSRTS